MKYVNLGCGQNYILEKEWTNLDFSSENSNVIEYNLLHGTPFDNNEFDLVYHSHVLEHFSKKDGENFIMECNRILKKNGIIRIAVPNLEQIIRNYIYYFESGLKDPNNDIIRANYDWLLIELFDQMIRNKSGGEMLEILTKKELINEEFIYSRNGSEAKKIREGYLNSKKTIYKPNYFQSIFSKWKFILKVIVNSKNIEEYLDQYPYYKIGKFRSEGEIHQWMYDRYSLSNLLKKNGFSNIKIFSAEESYLKNWKKYNLDSLKGETRKPDSIFIEGIKK